LTSKANQIRSGFGSSENVKCKLSPDVNRNERHLQLFDFINKMILKQKKASDDVDERKNLTLFLGTFPTGGKKRAATTETRKLRNKNKTKKKGNDEVEIVCLTLEVVVFRGTMPSVEGKDADGGRRWNDPSTDSTQGAPFLHIFPKRQWLREYLTKCTHRPDPKKARKEKKEKGERRRARDEQKIYLFPLLTRRNDCDIALNEHTHPTRRRSAVFDPSRLFCLFVSSTVAPLLLTLSLSWGFRCRDMHTKKCTKCI
jgi:hypothetical protein